MLCLLSAAVLKDRRRRLTLPSPFPPVPAGTSLNHADGAGTQIKTLQTVLRRLELGQIARVEGDWIYQISSGGNKKVVTAKQWKERLPKSFLWIDFCCIPQMSIPLTEQLLGFGEIEDDSSCGGGFGWSGGFGLAPLGEQRDDSPSGGGRRGSQCASLLLVKAAVLQELGGHHSKSAPLLGQQTQMSGNSQSSTNSFQDVRRETVNHGKGEPVPKEVDTDATTTDHRPRTDTEGWKKITKIMLGKAVQSIPAYIERSSLMIVLVPPCKHADRKDENCDESSWRGRGWCRVEYLAATLVRSDVSVMIVEDALTTPYFVWPVDGLQLPPGHGIYTCCSRTFSTTPPTSIPSSREECPT